MPENSGWLADPTTWTQGLTRIAMVNRDIYLLSSTDQGKSFKSTTIDPMRIGACVMSSAALTTGMGGEIGAWETRERVYFSKINPKSATFSRLTTPPGAGKGCKYPALAVNARGEMLLAWAEGTAWNKGGAVAWQVFNAEGKPISGHAGRQEGLQPWSAPAAFADKNGSFKLIY